MGNSKHLIRSYSLVNGINMYYEICGQGKPLALIHGGGSTLNTSFSRIIPMLAKSYQVVAMDLQAHGHTDDRNMSLSFEQDADDVVTLLHNLHIDKASIFGFSNGGNTAIQIAVRHPEVVNKLILASTFYKREGLPPGFFEGMKNATINVMPQPLKDAFLKIDPDQSHLLNMFNKDRERMLNFKDWKNEMLSAIKAPVLIINGDRDVILNEHAVKMAKLINNSRLMILPAEHGAYIGAAESSGADDAIIEMTVEIIKRFLSENIS